MPKKYDDGLTATQRYYRRHPERRRATDKKWRENNKERMRELRRNSYYKDTERARFNNIKSQYGITRKDYEAMMARQNHRCGVCRTPFAELALKHKRRPAVDHCHATSKVRGILCAPCNVRLSVLEDKTWREAAERYLARNNGG